MKSKNLKFFGPENSKNFLRKRIIPQVMIAMIVVLMLATTVQAAVPKFPQITISLINQEPDPVAPGNIVEMKLRIENEGSSPATDVQIRLVPKFPLTLYEELDTKMIGTLEGYQIGNIGIRSAWKLLVDPAAATGENKVEVWYMIKGGVWTKAEEFNITVRSRDAVLAINEIRVDQDKIVPGTKTNVAFVLENLADNSLGDIKLNLDLYSQVTTSTSVTFIELPFTPIGSGNEKSLRTLMAGGSQEIVFELFTDADAESKVYKVPYTLTYSDAVGTSFSRTGIVGLIVEATPELSVNVDSNDIPYAGAKGRVEIKLVNKGFSDIKFLNIVLDETDQYDILSNPESYIGKLDSDDYETAEYTLMVKPTVKEDVKLPIKIDYRDANGKLFSDEMELSFKVGKKPSPVLSIIIWIVIIAAIVIAIIYFRKKRAAKKNRR